MLDVFKSFFGANENFVPDEDVGALDAGSPVGGGGGGWLTFGTDPGFVGGKSPDGGGTAPSFGGGA